MQAQFRLLSNNQVLDLRDCPVGDIEEMKHLVRQASGTGAAHIAALFFVPDRTTTNGHLYCVINFREAGKLGLLKAPVEKEYPALTPDIPQAHWFEREIFETWQVRPLGHPWLKPIRSPYPASPAMDPPQSADFFRLEGEEVHEVAVGPVHAGVIEPGHFRFQCHGETILHLEIGLGYQHRGIEKRLIGGPHKKTIHYMETTAGDSTVGHTLAYCQLLEALAGISISEYTGITRTIAAELERLANHIGDLGALAGDVGFLPSRDYCGRIRGEILNLTASLCGNRFSRNLLLPGGVSAQLKKTEADMLRKKLEMYATDFYDAAGLIFSTPSVLARLEGTGRLSREQAVLCGLVGPAARACGIRQDVRCQNPYSGYCTSGLPLTLESGGDCYARAHIRLQEAEQSILFLYRQLEALPAWSSPQPLPGLLPQKMVVSLVEGWRGEICHIAATDSDGLFAFYKIIDPSFHNWFGLALSLRNQQISDFPLCNKSFNLSYCGHDL